MARCGESTIGEVRQQMRVSVFSDGPLPSGGRSLIAHGRLAMAVDPVLTRFFQARPWFPHVDPPERLKNYASTQAVTCPRLQLIVMLVTWVACWPS